MDGNPASAAVCGSDIMADLANMAGHLDRILG